jgi:Fe-S cluster biosynthesis and repair protein YggX
MNPQLQQQIAQFGKMAQDDPENELAHYRLGQLHMEAEDHGAAIKSFRRTLEISPQFSKVYQLLAAALTKSNQRDEAVRVLREGFAVADERGDNIPRDEMERMLVAMNEAVPARKRPAATEAAAIGDGFQCQRPGCFAGAKARRLPKPPVPDEIGQRIYDTVCADCWTDWLRNYSVKVINELRLDLSSEQGQAEYDRYMREFLGLE